MMTHDAITKIRSLLADFERHAEAALASDEQETAWEEAYDAIFSEEGSVRMRHLLDEIGVHLDYYDPDTTYEDDVLAYLRALKDLVAELPESVTETPDADEF